MRKKTKGRRKKKEVYKCSECGAEITVDDCGIGFTRMICCGKEMRKK